MTAGSFSCTTWGDCPLLPASPTSPNPAGGNLLKERKFFFWKPRLNPGCDVAPGGFLSRAEQPIPMRDFARRRQDLVVLIIVLVVCVCLSLWLEEIYP